MSIKKHVSSVIMNPKRIFLIDAIGAILTSFLLFGILAQFEEYFGMPKQIVYVLSAIAFCMFIYSSCCHRFIKSNWKPYLRTLIVFNILYILISIGMIIRYSENLTIVGWSYFIVEIIVIGMITYVEYRNTLITVRIYEDIY